MNYKIIDDEQKLSEFIEWLPSLKPHETFYISLFSRSKYYPVELDTSNLSSKAQLKRFTSNKKLLFDKIKQLECEVGSYKNNGLAVPQQSLALYITPNPRDMIKATKNSLIEFINKVTINYNGYNPHQIVLSELQKSGGTKKYIDFDFDGISHDKILLKIKDEDIINIDSITIIVTRGGFHLLVQLDKIGTKYIKSWYNKLSNLPGVDIKGTDNLLPVVGCCQGSFIPFFIK